VTMPAIRYLSGRLLGGLGTLVGGSIVAFVIVHLLPGDPAEVIAGKNASPARVEAIRRSFGLTDSLPEQLVEWWQRLLHLDLGVSTVSNIPVTQLLAERLPATFFLIAASTIIGLMFTVVFSLGGVRRGSAWDRAALGWSVFGLAVPVFWLGILLIIVFAVKLNLLPAGGYVSPWSSPLESLRFLLLPAVTFGVYLSAIFTQFLRRSLVDVMDEEFIRTARSKGLSELNVILHHAAKPALIPLVTVVGIAVPTSLGFAMVVESVFNYPGFGLLFVNAITGRDYFLVQAGIVVIIAAVVVSNILVDISYLLLNPRSREDA
jgi:peptide/nickel transport system permease protein